MITVTRFNGQPFAIAVSMIERVEAHPDTTIHCTNGHKYLVSEPLDVVIERVRRRHAEIRAVAHQMVASGHAEKLLDTPDTSGA